MKLREAGELRLVAAIRDALERRASGGGAGGSAGGGAGAPVAKDAGVRVGPGDDCAVVARPEGDLDLLLKVDEAIEGVHFEFAWAQARAVGRRAMAQALSDVAAMAGRARWATLALALREDLDFEDALALVEGAAERAAEYGCAVVGGNVARGPRVSIAVSVVGEVERGRALLRSGARPGDALYVTGEPGLARAGLLALMAGRAGEPALAAAVARWRDPRPRIEEARFLRDRAGARAMIDLSDGLAGDLARLAEASGVGARIERALLPARAALRAAARALGEDAADLALRGGEDFELLFAAPEEAVEAARPELEARFGGDCALARIGTIAAGREIVLVGAGGEVEPIAAAAHSYEHFRPAE